MSVKAVPSENPNDYCRLCFSDRNLVTLLHCDAEQRQNLLDEIFNCTGIKIEVDESQPCSICWRCAVAVEDYQLFRKRCLANDVIIRNSCSKATFIIEHCKDEPLEEMIESNHQSNMIEEKSVDKTLLEPMEGCSNLINEKSSKKVVRKKRVLQSAESTTCHLCKHEFSSRQSLNAHHKEQHSERGRPHKCNMCEATFKRKSHLEDHVSSHTGEIRFTCKDCGMGYANAKSLTRHRRTFHQELPAKRKPANRQPISTDGDYKCSYCPKTFKHRPSLNFHIKTHSELLEFVCLLCDIRFATKQGMLVHRGKHHSSPADSQKSLSPFFLEPKKKLSCKLCNRFFDQRHYLTQHQKYMHPNEFAGANQKNGEDLPVLHEETEGQDDVDDGATEIAIKFEAEDHGFLYDNSYNENESNMS